MTSAPLAVGERLHLVLELAVGVVDHLIGARRLRRFALGFAAGGGEDARAHGLAELDRGEAHAAARAEHQQGFAGQQFAALLEGVVAGAVGGGPGGRLAHGHAVGDRAQAGAHHDFFRRCRHGRRPR